MSLLPAAGGSVDNSVLDPILDRCYRGHCWIKTADGPRRIDEPLTAHHVARHLTGKAAFGVCPLAPGESTVRLALFDFDSHGGETSPEAMTEVVTRVIGHCAQFSLQPIAFRSSGGNGIHLYFIWDAPQDAYSVRIRLRQVLEASGLKPGTGGVHKNEVEIFPKQSSVPLNGYGSMFILPLAGKSVRLGVKND